MDRRGSFMPSPTWTTSKTGKEARSLYSGCLLPGMLGRAGPGQGSSPTEGVALPPACAFDERFLLILATSRQSLHLLESSV